MKNPTRLSTAGVSSARIGIRAARPAVCATAAWSSQPANINGTATTTPNTPAAMIAVHAPDWVTSSIMIGARAQPRKPAKVWIENALPSRGGSMTEPRME